MVLGSRAAAWILSLAALSAHAQVDGVEVNDDELSAIESESPSDGSPGVDVEPAPAAAPAPKSRMVSVGVVSWQNSFSGILVNAAGMSPNFEWAWRRDSFDWGVSARAVLLTAQVGNNSREPLAFVYAERNVAIYGGGGAGFVRWRPFSPDVAFGVELPVVFGKTKFKAPGADSIDQSSVLVAGLWLEARLQKNRFCFAQKVGTVKGARGLAWLFELGYSL